MLYKILPVCNLRQIIYLIYIPNLPPPRQASCHMDQLMNFSTFTGN